MRNAIDRFELGDDDGGLAEIDDAIRSVDRDPTFIVDAVLALVEARKLEAAERLVGGSAWPSNAPGAREVIVRLEDAKSTSATTSTTAPHVGALSSIIDPPRASERTIRRPNAKKFETLSWRAIDKCANSRAGRWS